ncbi:MAG: thiosulfate oxidation carrier protein SoxY [Burkholderiales bacterium]|nr:thiosulfate oxidation carrier protein SoxY [Burkholderiales bacterium]
MSGSVPSPLHPEQETSSVNTRRKMLSDSARVAAALAAAGWLPNVAFAQSAGAWNKAAFEAKTMADLMKAMGASAPAESKDVTLTAPDIAENGAVVPIGVATTAAGVKQLLVLVEKNPNTLAAYFDVTDAVEPSFSTRVKMGQSSDVYAVAITGDGKALFAKKEVKVTLGGCGG